jgi:hypothetical protein
VDSAGIFAMRSNTDMSLSMNRFAVPTAIKAAWNPSILTVDARLDFSLSSFRLPAASLTVIAPATQAVRTGLPSCLILAERASSTKYSMAGETSLKP